MVASDAMFWSSDVGVELGSAIVAVGIMVMVVGIMRIMGLELEALSIGRQLARLNSTFGVLINRALTFAHLRRLSLPRHLHRWLQVK